MLTWDGKPVEIVRRGSFKTCVRYVHLFKSLHRSEREFYVLTSELEAQNESGEKSGCDG